MKNKFFLLSLLICLISPQYLFADSIVSGGNAVENLTNISQYWSRFYLFTTKAQRSYTEVSYPAGAALVFGKETAGLPEELLVQHPDRCVRIPMLGGIRSLNLSNSVAVAVYEGLRQNNFDGFARQGELHRLKW